MGDLYLKSLPWIMDVLNLLAEGAAQPEGNTEGPRQSHQYPTRQALTSLNSYDARKGIRNSMESPAKAYNGLPAAGGPRPSPNGKQQKHVMFELLLNKSAQHRARLPMRVMISPHDTTESILTTVRNFYGLYEGPGVSFEDREGNIIIARHENFENDMTVYVRVTTPDPEVVAAASGRVSLSPRKPKLGAPFEMRPPSRNQTRHGSNAANGRSVSPQSNKSYRSNSALPGAKSRGRSTKSREPTALGEVADGYSDSDGGNGSVTSSRRSKVEPHASAEISVDNIVEGGRRKRAKFESSVRTNSFHDKESGPNTLHRNCLSSYPRRYLWRPQTPQCRPYDVRTALLVLQRSTATNTPFPTRSHCLHLRAMEGLATNMDQLELTARAHTTTADAQSLTAHHASLPVASCPLRNPPSEV